MLSRLACVMVVAALPAPRIAAQIAPGPDTHVRVTADCQRPDQRPGRAASPHRRGGSGTQCTRYEGLLRHLSSDSLEIATGDSTLALARAQVHRVQVRGSRKSNWRTGGTIGAAAGAAVGLALAAAAAGQDCSGYFQGVCEASAGMSVIGAPIMGAAAGFVVGAGIGSAVTSHSWETVRLPAGRAQQPRPIVLLGLRLPL